MKMCTGLMLWVWPQNVAQSKFFQVRNCKYTSAPRTEHQWPLIKTRFRFIQ